MSTALRMPSAAKGVALCSAELVPTTTLDHKATLLDKRCYRECLGVVTFRVLHTATPHSEANWAAEGHCWTQLFLSCSMVIGYPIPSRNSRMPGLEIPLDIMTALMGADRITSFGNDLIIKGYSDLFYATEHHDDCVMWHLICNKSPTARISFADRRIPQSTERKLSLPRPVDVARMRHIVGWTSPVRSNAGRCAFQTSGIPITDHIDVARRP